MANYGKLRRTQRGSLNLGLTPHLHNDDDGRAEWTTCCWLWKTS